MPCSACTPARPRPDAAGLNDRIRALTAGRVAWTPEALAELARLQAEWRAATEAEREV